VRSERASLINSNKVLILGIRLVLDPKLSLDLLIFVIKMANESTDLLKICGKGTYTARR
jgi:hypothetical protein